jgi:hypothetical protein
MTGKTSFSLADLKALKAETETIRESLSRLSQHLLEANLAHTKAHFYDGAVRRVSDHLASRLNAVDDLLYRERAKHAFATAKEMI